ncbi:MAG: cytochrome c family protein [Blastocatellia bacterium]|nr:cytochrome c family protein [Blastocatellia bacterium]MCS7158056.1 cytochrome c family protein [Blastocatellia bacterium]MCX7752563.1 cytochrome c family protein [Blastocatellia bacterium]MDW8167321.1 cytochrome c3 family protein [Acidobacteriota bacterium]MDW8257353.1 cytochrome c3 family protein [Acidobacteriota bacterium]
MRQRSLLKLFAVGGILLFFVVVLTVGRSSALAPQGNPSAEWRRSRHANRDTAVAEATVERRGTGAAHCGRCHSEQGFIAWVPQLLAGDPGFIKKPDGSAADEAYLRSLGLTTDRVQPITCRTCHGDDFQMRIRDNTPMLPAGFEAWAVGQGAICMTCHNTRNDRIKWDAADPGRYTAPHYSAEADVIMGKNAFFLDDTVNGASPHGLFVGDSCVTCHLTLGKDGHTFQASETSCVSCHGPSMTIEFVQKPIETLLEQVKAAIERRILAVRDQIGVVRRWDPATGAYTENFPLDGRQIRKLAEIRSIGGLISFRFTLADGTEVYARAGEIWDRPGGRRIFATSDPIIRASWNYLLIKYDGSLGVHNPSFARNVLLATLRALR